MLVNEWVESFWAVLNVRPKTLHDYKRLYKRHLAPSIGAYEIDSAPPMVLQQKLLSLPPQTSRHCLMLVKTIYREAKLYRVCVVNPADGLKTPRFKSLTRSFLLGKKLTPLTGVDTTNRFASFAFVHYGCGGFVKKLARVKRDLYEPEKASPEIVVGDSE